jgi:putative transposase
MYRWRKLTSSQRAEVLQERRRKGRPIHSPRHYDSGLGWYLISAACFEHAPHIGRTEERMEKFSQDLVSVLGEHREIGAWVVLPNHYHAVVLTERVLDLLKALGRLHGRTSFVWNSEEQTRGRKVWFNALERALLTDDHHYAALNYVLHNPVKHGLTKRWTDWQWSSAESYLGKLGREEAERRWKEFPPEKAGDVAV